MLKPRTYYAVCKTLLEYIQRKFLDVAPYCATAAYIYIITYNFGLNIVTYTRTSDNVEF